MAATFLMIDGYNLLHAAGLARRRYATGQMERARNALINLLARHLNDATRDRTTVVFDAQNAPSIASTPSRQQGIEVVFAPPGGDADTLIEQLVREHSAPKQLLVISGDRRLQKAIRRRRGHWLDSESFHRWLLEPESSRSPQPGRSRLKPGPRPSTSAKKPVDLPPPLATGESESGSGDSPDPAASQSASDVDQVEFWQDRVDELLAEQPRHRRHRKHRRR